MHPEMLEHQVIEENLFRLRLEIASHTSSEPWSMSELEAVLDTLKDRKTSCRERVFRLV